MKCRIKKLFYLLLFVALITCACFRVDNKSDELNFNSSFIVKENNEKLKYENFSDKNLNGIDYRLSGSKIGKFGGELVTSTIGEGPKTFNPWVSKDATSSQIGELLYDSLLTTDPITGEVIPKLAKSFSVSSNKREYVITLRKGVKWSDGKEITADDVVFTWNEIILAGLGNTSLKDSVLIDGEYPLVEKSDRYTVKFSIKKPYAPFLRFIGTQIAPMHIFKPIVEKGERYFNSYLGTTINPKDIVCSGAFLLDEYIPAQRVVFKRNPNYYAINKNDEKLPYLDKYIILIVGDLNNEFLKFEAGELDIISVRGKDLPRFKEKEKSSNFKIYNLGPNTGTTFIAFNLNTRKNSDGKFYVNPQKQSWFNDINFRTAIDYAIDRNAIVNNVANGVAEPLFTAESLSSIFLNENLAMGHERNIEYAKDLLFKSGFNIDRNGLLHDKQGNTVEFDLYTNAGNLEREACGVMIKEDLKDIGIRVNFKPIEFNSLVSRLMSTFDWDVVLMGLTGSPLEPHSGQNVWRSNGHLHLFNMRKQDEFKTDILDWEKDLDKIIDDGALELDYDKRKIIYDKYQQIIYDNRPIIYLYSPLTIVAVRNNIKNIYPTQLGGTVHNLEELYIEN